MRPFASSFYGSPSALTIGPGVMQGGSSADHIGNRAAPYIAAGVSIVRRLILRK